MEVVGLSVSQVQQEEKSCFFGLYDYEIVEEVEE